MSDRALRLPAAVLRASLLTWPPTTSAARTIATHENRNLHKIDGLFPRPKDPPSAAVARPPPLPSQSKGRSRLIACKSEDAPPKGWFPSFASNSDKTTWPRQQRLGLSTLSIDAPEWASKLRYVNVVRPSTTSEAGFGRIFPRPVSLWLLSTLSDSKSQALPTFGEVLIFLKSEVARINKNIACGTTEPPPKSTAILRHTSALST